MVEYTARMQGKRVIITGGSAGIGLATAQALYGLGAHVVLASRDAGRGAGAVAQLRGRASQGSVVWRELDLGSAASIAAFAEATLHDGDPSVLINNAAVWPRQRRLTVDGREQTLAVNHLGHMQLTLALLPGLRRRKGRVIVVSSGYHARGKMQWDDLWFAEGGFSGQRAYAQSKLANLLFTIELAKRERTTGVTVNALHPGIVKTALAREFPELIGPNIKTMTPAQAAKTAVYLASAPEVAGVTSRYFVDCRPQAPAAQAGSRADAERLWTWSLEQLGRYSQLG